MNIEQKPTGLDQKMMKKVSNHLDGLLKPPGSLGELEHMAVRLAGIYGTERIEIRKPRLLIFAADHGVTAEGVASAPKEFTFRQTAYIVQSLTGAGVLAKQAGADLAVIDVGIDSQKTIPGVTCAKIRRGTGNILHEDAMTEKNLEQALEAGARAVRMALEEGSNLIGVGEMGIGNTTASSAILHAMHPEAELSSLVGKGAGLSEEAYQHKIEVIREAVQNRRPDPNSVKDVLKKVGGLEIAAMAGAYLEAARAGVPAVVDGMISMTAAYAAWKLDPDVLPYLFASHYSAEPAYRFMIEKTGLTPVLNLNMRLGEGSGCPMMFFLLSCAAAINNEMASFEDVQDSGDFLVDIREEAE